MDVDKVPVWVWGAGAVVVVLALLQRNSSAQAAPIVTNIGAADSPYAEAKLQASSSGFDKLVGFASDSIQTNAARDTAMASIGAQVAQAQISAGTTIQTAQITAATESQRITAAQQASAVQSNSQLAATRSTNKSNVVGQIVGGIVSIGSKLLGFL